MMTPARTPVLVAFAALLACSDDMEGAGSDCDTDCTCNSACEGSSGSVGASNSGIGGASDADSTTSSGPAPVDGPGSGTETGDAPALSILPPYGIEGAQWRRRQESFDLDIVQHITCTVTNTFTWPDGVAGSTLHCYVDESGVSTTDTHYAIFEDRIVLRAAGDAELMPEAELLHVPMEVGESWQVVWQIGGFPTNTETWTVVGQEELDLEIGTVTAAKIEFTNETSYGSASSTYWLADGIGFVLSESDDYRTELLSFTLP